MYLRTVLRYKSYDFLKFILRSLSSQANVKSDANLYSEVNPKLSTLFVPGRHGADVYQIVKPFIDINFLADNLEILKVSCENREINLDLANVIKLAKEWWRIKSEYEAFVEKQMEKVNELQRLTQIGDKKSFQTLNEKKDEIFETIGLEKIKLHDIEDIVMPLFQKLPHILHPNTPLKSNVTEIFQGPTTNNRIGESHTNIAKHLLHFTNIQSVSYYMTGKLSELDIAIQLYFIDKLNNFDFLPLSCMDFCKSFILEAIGFDPYSSMIIREKGSHKVGQKMHLVGGASFETFCAYLANMNVNKSTLPMKYYSVGRRYNAANKENNLQNLFSVVQSSNVHCVILTEKFSFKAFDSLLQSMQECYLELNIPFRVVNIGAKNLTMAESQRKQLELWSPALKDFVPVAYVSQHDDFVSKRLQITYGIQHVKEGYCHIVEGAFANISVLIGCIVENFQDKTNDFSIPTVLEKYLLLRE